MTATRARIVLASILGAALLIGQPAYSMGGGGGGGGGGMDSGPAYDPAPDYQKGIAAYQAGDWKGAIGAFRRVTGGVPNFTAGLFLLGSSYLQAGDFKNARRPLEQAVKGDPSLIEGHRDLAIVLLRLNDPAKAAAQRDLLVAMKTKCAGACANAAKLDAAIAAVGEAMKSPAQSRAPVDRPQLALDQAVSAEAVYVAAVSLINEHRYEAAIGSLEGALWSLGPDADLITYLGFANRKLRHYDTARGWYEMALAIDPHHRGALEYYGELKLETGDLAGARRHLARLDDLCPYGCVQADELRRWLREGAKSAS